MLPEKMERHNMEDHLFEMSDNPWENERCDNLRKRCQAFLKDLTAHAESLDPDKLVKQLGAVTREYANESTLHRGFYCPSPVRDLVVDNEIRGSLLAAAPEDGFVYTLNDKGALVLCEEYRKGNLQQREFLLRDRELVYGFSWLPSGELVNMSRERYENGKLVEYVYAGCDPEDAQCFVEDYHYDALGLESSEHCCYEIQTGIVRQWRYLFERENGMLTAYYASRSGCPFPKDANGNCIAQEITVERKS